MSEPYMPTPLCQHPGCDNPVTSMAVCDGLGVCHCEKHGAWAQQKAAIAADTLTPKETPHG